MSAFGKKNGLGGGKPSSFGVAKPMTGGGPKTAANREENRSSDPEGGDHVLGSWFSEYFRLEE